MLPYYLVIIFAFLFCAFDYVHNRLVQFYVFFGYIFLLLMLTAFRPIGVDNDSINYSAIFDTLNYLNWERALSGEEYRADVEFGYVILNKGVGYFGGSFRTVAFIMAVSSILTNAILIFWKSPYPFTSVLIYVSFFFFYRDFTQIRYAVSAGFLVCALFLFIEKKYVLWVFFQFLAISFHNSSWVGLLLIIMMLIIKNRLFYLLLPLLGLVSLIIDPVDILFSLLDLPKQLQKYLVFEDKQAGYAVSIVAQTILIGSFIFYKKLLDHFPEKHVRLLFIAVSIGSFINLLYYNFSIMQRLAGMLFGCSVFLAPYLFYSLETSRDDKILSLIIHFLFNSFLLYYGLRIIAPDILRPYFG